MADLGAVGENGLLTKRTSFGQASPWDNNGAEQGLITKRTGLYLDLAWDNSGGENGLLTKRSFFDHIPSPDNPAPEFPQAEVVNPFVCQKAIRQCLPCDDDPLANISAEDADVDRYIGVIPEWPDQPITGDPFNIYFSWGCLGICYSIISQEDADLCASNQAIECVADAPGGTTPANPGNPRGLFSSTEQTCAVPCSGGGTFSFTLAAGGVLSPYSQADANARAAALACKLGKMFKICIVVIGATDVCKDDFASFVLRFTGPISQFPLSSEWSITGPGIAVNLFSYDTSEAAVFGTTQMRIFGTPTVAGDTYIIARITDNNSGFFMERQIPISVNQCDVDWGNITPAIDSAAITYWDSGNDIPAGIYRVAYFNGAWISPGPIYLVGDGVPAAGKGRGYYIKYDDGAQEVAFPPSGLYSSQSECEAANAGASITFAHTGGKIGMYLHDSPYNDNTDGSPNPTFKLETI